MSDQPSNPLVLGFRVLDEIPSILRPLADDTVVCYRRHHSDLRSVYVIGSVAVGEWMPGVSDLDVVGVVEGEVHPDNEAARRRELSTLGVSWPQVSFINNSQDLQQIFMEIITDLFVIPETTKRAREDFLRRRKIQGQDS